MPIQLSGPVSQLACVCFVLLSGSFVTTSNAGFLSSHRTICRSHVTFTPISIDRGYSHIHAHRNRRPFGSRLDIRPSPQIWLQLEEEAVDTPGEESEEISGGFDGGGFANYLGPYFLAVVLALAATAAFFKFVLMDI